MANEKMTNYNNIRNLIKTNQLDLAKKRIIESLSIYPYDHSLIFELSRISFIKKDYKKSKELLEEVLNINNLDTYAMFQLAKTYSALGDLDESERIYLGIISINPNDNFSKLELAKVYIEQNKLSEAKFFLKDILHTKSYIYAKFELGKIYMLENRYEDAKKCFKEILNNKPNDTHTKLELARIYTKQGKFDKSESLLKEILNAKSNDKYAKVELIKLYSLLRKNGEAIKMLENDKSLNEDPYCRLELARLYVDIYEFDKSKNILEELSSIKFKTEIETKAFLYTVKLRLSVLYYKKGNYTLAQKLINQLLQNSTDRRVRFTLAKIYMKEENYNKAKEILEKLLNEENTDVQVKFELSKIYAKEGNIDIAIKNFNSLLNTEKKYYAKRELGKIYSNLGQFSKAYKIYDEIKKANDSEIINLYLAKSYSDQGLYDMALDEINRVLLLHKKDDYVRLELAKVLIAKGEKSKAIDILMNLQNEENKNKALTELMFIDINEYKYEDAMLKLNKVYNLLENGNQIKNFLCYKLNLPFQNENDYFTKQLVDYSYDTFMNKMNTKYYNFQSEITNARFINDDIISKLYNKIQNRLDKINPVSKTLFDKYIIGFNEIIGTANDISTTLVAVITYSNSKDILMFYPVSSEYIVSSNKKELKLIN